MGLLLFAEPDIVTSINDKIIISNRCEIFYTFLPNNLISRSRNNSCNINTGIIRSIILSYKTIFRFIDDTFFIWPVLGDLNDRNFLFHKLDFLKLYLFISTLPFTGFPLTNTEIENNSIAKIYLNNLLLLTDNYQLILNIPFENYSNNITIGFACNATNISVGSIYNTEYFKHYFSLIFPNITNFELKEIEFDFSYSIIVEQT